MFTRLSLLVLCIATLPAGCAIHGEQPSVPHVGAQPSPASPDARPAPAPAGSGSQTGANSVHMRYMPLSAFKVVGEHPLSVNAASFVVSTPDGDVPVKKVQLTEAHFQRAVSPDEGPAGGSEIVWCYELKPTDENIRWTWAVCDRDRAFYTAVVSGPSGAYFAWMVTAVLSFEPIKKPRDRAAALEAFHSAQAGSPTPDLVTLAPTMLVGIAPFDVHAPAELKISVQSIERGPDGSWTVRVTGKDPGKVFTMVGKGAEWRAQ